MEEKLPELPQGWVWVELNDVISRISNGVTLKQNKIKTGLPVTRIETISRETIDLSRVGYFNNVSDQIIDKYKLLFGDILFSHINSDSHLGKTAIFISNELVLHGMNLLLIRPDHLLILPIFLHFTFKYLRHKGQFYAIAQHAVNQSSINQRTLKKVALPLPPIPEQHRIVDKIEELFTRLDAGIESLKKVQAQMKRYRQAVLKHAFEGNLTAAWREANRHIFEPASTQLERIKEERKKKITGKPKELTSLDTSELPELPDGWVWVTLSNISEVNPKLPEININEEDKVSFLPMKAIKELTGQYDLSIIKIYQDVKKGYTPFINKDILFAKITPCMENGKVAVINNLVNGVGFGSTEFHVIRIDENKLLQEYLFFYFIQDTFRERAKRNMTGSAGQLRVPVNYLKNALIVLPPLEEQNKIVEEIERRFSIADRIEEIVEQNLKKAERLRQSILKRAFEGKLVPQDSSDEPAAVLLERIKAEKEKCASKNDQRRRSNK